MIIKKRALAALLIVFIFLSCCCSVNADELETAETTAVPTADTSGEVFSIFKNTLTIVSFIVGTLLPALIILFFGKEIPKKHVPFFSLGFLILLIVYRVPLYYLNHAEIFGIIYLTVLFVILSIAWIYIFNKFIAKKTTDDSSKLLKPEMKAIGYMKRQMHSGHRALESIQLYTFVESEQTNTTRFTVEYIDGVMRQHTEINAMMRMCLHVDNDTIIKVRGILSLYKQYIEGSSPASEETLRTALVTAIEEDSKRIKSTLESIDSAREVKGTDCCLARILMLYCSLLASLNKETTFVGFGENALNLKEDIEKALFTQKRTGVLGTILLQDYPYGFYYTRSSEKRGRTYCSFICSSNDKNYLVLIAFRMRDGSLVPNFAISNTLSRIRNELSNILGSPNKEVATVEN